MIARPAVSAAPDPANDNRSPWERLRFWLAWSRLVGALREDARKEAAQNGA